MVDRRTPHQWTLFGWAALAIVAVAVVAFPLFDLGREIVRAGWDAVSAVLGSAASWTPMANTLWTSLAVTALTLTVATTAAVWTRSLSPAARRWVWAGMMLPFLVPPFVSALSWVAAYGPGGLMDDVTGLALPGLVGAPGIVVVLAVNATPIAFLIVAAALATRYERDLVRAARVSGASAGEAFRTVTFPLLRPALVAAGAVTFIMSANSFGVPVVLGSPARFTTATTRLYSDLVFSADPAAFDRVLVLAAFLALVTLSVVAVADRSARGRVRLRVEAAGPRSGAIAGRSGSGIVIAVYLVVTTALPLVALILTAVTRGVGVAPVPGNWTLGNFREAFAAGAATALRNSLLLAVVAATIVLLLGSLLVALERRRRSSLGTFAALAFAVPGSVLAVAVLLAYGSWLRDTVLIILVAYVAKFWALGHRPIAGSADAISPELFGAARVSGAAPVAAARTVVVPLLRPALGAAWLIVFIFALHELTMSSLLYGPGSETLAVAVLNLRQLGDPTVTAALAVLLTAGVAVAALPLVRLWSKRRTVVG